MKRIYCLLVGCIAWLGILCSCNDIQMQPAVTTPALTSVSTTPLPTASPTPTPVPTPIVSTVKFSATGDNLIHSSIYDDAATKAKEAGKGDDYDFSYCYENMAHFYDDYDVNWINQETLINDVFAPSDYPCFSTPIEMANNLYEIGMRVFSLANNHTYDKGANGISGTLAFWDSMPEDVVTTGLWDEETTEDEIPLHEVNGISIAYLSYTHSTNGIPTPANAPSTIIYTTETERIEKQVRLARTLADIVVVGVHWGIEDSHAVHSSQQTLAQNLSDWGADLIIGTHPHVLQYGEWLTAEDGRETFVIYSLGNFVSAQSKADNLIGGILSITFQKTIALDGSETIELVSPQVHPIVTHYDWGYQYPRVYLWEDYTPEQATIHGVTSHDARFTYDYIKQVISENISEEFLNVTK